MTSDGLSARPPEVVAAAYVDPVLWDMNSELLELRQQLVELRRTLAERERQLLEAKQGSEASQRAVGTLNDVLTEMVLEARAELQVARENAKRAAADRLAEARADSDRLVADAAAALTAAVSRPTEEPPPPPAAQRRLSDAPPPPPASARPRPEDAPAPPAKPGASDGFPPPAGEPRPSDPPPGLAARPRPSAPPPMPPAASPAASPGPIDSPPAGPSPAAEIVEAGTSVAHRAAAGWGLEESAVPSPPPTSDAGDSGFPAIDTPPPPGHETFDWPSGPQRRPMNGSSGRRTSVPTLDYDLDEQFQQVVALPPNTEFRTPPRGTPAVPGSPPSDLTLTTPAVSRAGAVGRAEDAFDAFWPGSGAAPPNPAGLALEGSAAGTLRFGLIDALLPIVAMTLVLVVVLSWLG